MVQSIEALYGPPHWGPGEWMPESGVRPRASPTTRRSRKPRVLPTLVLGTAAAFSWFVLAGVRAAPEQSVVLTPEYLVATRTLNSGGVLASSDPRVAQLKGLFDRLSPKCKETRSELADALIAAHDELATRGIDESALSVLARADASLSDQTRPSWPTSCTDVLIRIVAATTQGH